MFLFKSLHCDNQEAATAAPKPTSKPTLERRSTAVVAEQEGASGHAEVEAAEKQGGSTVTSAEALEKVAEAEAAPEAVPEEDPELQRRRELVLRTPGFDARFPNTNQMRNCWQNYVDYFRCVAAKGDDFEPCKHFQQVYRSLCPVSWVDNWDEQRDANVFPGLAEGRWPTGGMPAKMPEHS